jgi:oligopeptide transport system substrate-binding protein
VLDEIYYAISEEKTIIPFRIENLNPSGAMKLHLSSQHWLDAYKPSWHKHLDRLVEIVSSNLWHIVSSAPQKRMETQPDKRKRPWFWIGSTVILAVVLVVFGGVWGINRGKISETTHTASAFQPNNTIRSTLEILPTKELLPLVDPTVEPRAIFPPLATDVVLNGYFVNTVFSLDPHVWPVSSTGYLLENLFIQLTNYDIEIDEVVPEAATSWTISPDGKFYTFKLRTDIPWVTHTFGGETVQVLDETGVPRFVTAQDFVYAFRRLCDPRFDDEDLSLVYFHGLIKGCQQAAEYEDPQNIPPEMFEAIGVRAVAEDELLFELEKPSGYFLSMTGMWLFSAIPQWTIEKYGDAWSSPGITPTNGNYVIDDFIPGESMRWIRNDLLPSDMAGVGNINVVDFSILADNSKAYPLWLENKLDYSAIPEEELLKHRTNYNNETIQVFGQNVAMIAFHMQDSPFDNVHVRRAFAAAFDRENFVNSAMKGQGLAMKHLTPPVVFGAPPINEIGVGYDLDFAHAELAAAGHPDCQGIPHLTLFARKGRNLQTLSEAVRVWEENLNCPEGTITIETGSKFSEGMDADLMLFSWGSDYPDAHDWFGSILTCRYAFFVMQRTCNEIDDLITQAAQEIVPVKRIELYAQIEESLFGKEGETPLFPIYWSANFTAEHTWLERSDTPIYNWNIDMEAKLVVTGE